MVTSKEKVISTESIAKDLKKKLPEFTAGIAIVEHEGGYMVYEKRYPSHDEYLERFYWASTQNMAMQLCFRGPQNRRN